MSDIVKKKRNLIYLNKTWILTQGQFLNPHLKKECLTVKNSECIRYKKDNWLKWHHSDDQSAFNQALTNLPYNPIWVDKILLPDHLVRQQPERSNVSPIVECSNKSLHAKMDFFEINVILIPIKSSPIEIEDDSSVFTIIILHELNFFGA